MALRRADRKIAKDVASKQAYQKQFGSRIKRRDRTTPTYAQWVTASGTEKGLMAAGVGQKKLRRMK